MHGAIETRFEAWRGAKRFVLPSHTSRWAEVRFHLKRAAQLALGATAGRGSPLMTCDEAIADAGAFRPADAVSSPARAATAAARPSPGCADETSEPQRETRSGPAEGTR
jgi:hypothetical protein